MPSYSFLLLLLLIPATCIIYYSISNQYKSYVLFLSSIIFIFVLSISVAIFSLLFALLNFFLGIWLDKKEISPFAKNGMFWFAIILDIAILSFFKYLNPLFSEIDSNFFSTGIYVQFPYRSIMIPIGISYYTFQSLGYLIRIDRGSEKAEHNFAVFATYLFFFPKFFAGPVERSNHFFPQLKNPIKFDKNNVLMGARLFLWGLFKKLVIADNLYGAVSNVYSDVHHYTGVTLLIVLIVQTVYIYCDFSGYTDMALGLAKIFGINLIDNFKRPFLAKNISDFWRRWHISLSSWCNDFIYNPFIVKFRKLGNNAVIIAIFLTFFVVGIWHGDKWTFVTLGILQGIAIVYEFYTKRKRLKIASRFNKSFINTVSRIIVFLFMSVSMVFFFSNSIRDALYFLIHLFSGIHINSNQFAFINNKPDFLFALFCFLLLFIIEMFNEKGKNLMAVYLKQPAWVQWIGYVTCIIMIYLFYPRIFPPYYMRF